MAFRKILLLALVAATMSSCAQHQVHIASIRITSMPKITNAAPAMVPVLASQPLPVETNAAVGSPVKRG